MRIFSRHLLDLRSLRICAMLGALLCLSAPLYAQTQSSCPGDMDSTQRGSGQDIQCRINNFLGGTQTLINDVKSRSSNCGNDPHCTLLNDMITRTQNAHDRGMRANNRMTGDDYADLNTIRKEKCKGAKNDCATGGANAMYSGGDNDSTVGQDMANQLDDATNALNDAHNAMQNSQTASVTTIAPVFPTDTLSPATTFESLNDFTADPAPGEAHNGMQDAQAASSMATTPTSATDPPSSTSSVGSLTDITGDSNYPSWFIGSTNDQGQNVPAAPSAGIMLAIVLEKNAAEDVDKAFEDACKQEVVVAGEGGNTSVACTVMTIAADIAETAAESEELIDTESTDWLVTGIYLRENDLNNNLGQVDGDVLSVQASAGNTQASVTQLQAQVAALQVSVTALKTQLANAESVLSQKLNVNNAMNKQIMQLLLVPSGSRSVPASLLSCTGDSSTGSPCPTVALSCSAATGQCTFSSH